MSTNFIRSLANRFILRANSFSTSQIRLDSYKAAVIKELKKPLVIQELKPKKLENKQVRIQVNYCSVNSTDVQTFKLKEQHLPVIPGYEFSGEILEVGPEVCKLAAQVGDRVAVLSKTNGGFAEQCVVDVDDVWKLPSKVKLKSAAVMLHGHTNAIYTFSHLIKLNEKFKVVISAGPAGLGLAAIDVCANVFKIKPLGVCDTEERTELVRERGAFKTALFSSKNLKKDLDLGQGADIVYDAVGGEIHKLLTSCAAHEGHVFWAAPYPNKDIPPPPVNASLTMVNFKHLRKTNPSYFRLLVQDTVDMADQGLIKPHISAKYSLKDVNEAVKFIEEKKCTGKVVINVCESD